MRSNWISPIFVLFLAAALLLAAPRNLAAQDQPEPESAPHIAWEWLKQGQISANVRYRFEGFERDGAPFTAPAYAPTLRIAFGYETPSFHCFNTFAQGEDVILTGPADYSYPPLPSQYRRAQPPLLWPT